MGSNRAGSEAAATGELAAGVGSSVAEVHALAPLVALACRTDAAGYPFTGHDIPTGGAGNVRPVACPRLRLQVSNRRRIEVGVARPRIPRRAHPVFALLVETARSTGAFAAVVPAFSTHAVRLAVGGALACGAHQSRRALAAASLAAIIPASFADAIGNARPRLALVRHALVAFRACAAAPVAAVGPALLVVAVRLAGGLAQPLSGAGELRWARPATPFALVVSALLAVAFGNAILVAEAIPVA